MDLRSGLFDMVVFQRAVEIATMIASRVRTWDHFDKVTLGTQLVRAADSAVSNISEGYGRMTHREARNHYIIARGSLHEVLGQCRLAHLRGLLSDKDQELLLELTQRTIGALNGLISYKTRQLVK
jgi:four helix bundle protein